jgi:hypothetical protein
MATVKEGNHTHAADDIDCPVSEIQCLCQYQVVNYCPRILNCHQSAVGSQLPHPVEPYSLFSRHPVVNMVCEHR